MKNIRLISTSFLTFSLFIAANVPYHSRIAESGIQFYEGSWEEALELAKKEDKLIFMDVYATWCRPCKAMKKNTFADPDAGSYFNEHFVNVAIDGETTEGRRIIRKFGVRAYPTLLFVNADETLVAGTTGYHNPRQLIALGKQVRKEE